MVGDNQKSEKKMTDQPRIYCFSLFDTGYCSVHSLVRDLFDSPKNICPALRQGDLLYVQSKNPPAKALHKNCIAVESIQPDIKTINLQSHVAFCNRHRESVIPKKICPKDALEKFCKMSGLKTDNAEARFLGPHRENKFNVENAFCVQGAFSVLDHKALNQVLLNGIGSRKSYGYGLVLIQKSSTEQQGGKNESID